MSKRNSIKLFHVAVLFLVISALPANAQNNRPKAANSKDPALQRILPDVGSIVVYTNFFGVNHHGWNHGSGWFVDAPEFFNQVLGHSFKTGASSVTFADTSLALGLYSSPGHGCCGPHPNIYLMSDAGGVPGTVLDGPLTQLWGIAKFSDGGDIVEFDCVTCPTLSPNTTYWIVANETEANFEDTWDQSHSGDISSGNFVFNQVGSISGPWTVADGLPRGAFQVDAN
jgi:hypothetical protein